MQGQARLAFAEPPPMVAVASIATAKVQKKSIKSKYFSNLFLNNLKC